MAANWTPITIPNGAGDIATFAKSNTRNVSLSADIEVDSITFDSGADPFTISTGEASSLIIKGAGIINNSGIAQNFAAAAGSNSYGAIVFWNSASSGISTTFTTGGGPYSSSAVAFINNATAGSSHFTVLGAPAAFQIGGYAQFADDSSAENAVLTNNGGMVENAPGGQIGFLGNATAANAVITNNGGPSNNTGNTSGGSTSFADNSTAGNCMITNNGGLGTGSTGGLTHFGGGTGTSDAGTATLIANGGTNGGAGGQITFDPSSTGGQCRIEVFGNGTFGFPSQSELAIGSLEGDGVAVLGSTLTIGSNNLSTVFSGVMQGIGSALVKIGPGALTLSGANSYNGSTSILAGKLIVDGSITSDVFVNTGGTLSGGGSVNNVTVNNGGRVAPGDPKTLTVNGDYQQNNGSTLALLISGTGPAEFDQLVVTGNVTLATGSVLELDFSNQFAPHTGDTFNLLTFGSLSGDFTTVNVVGLANGFQYSITDDGSGHLQLKALNNGVAASTAKKLLNISTRLDVLTDDKVLIGGFIITGSSPKKVILRAIGPSLASQGVAGVLADPVLELHEPGGVVITNDNWKTTQEQEIIATGIPPTNDLESAIVATLDPGACTAILRGVENGTGVALVEAYDIDQPADAELANVSTRGFVQTGDDVIIGGVILGGDSVQSSEVVLRTIGPSLMKAGITDPLHDPVLELHDKDGVLIASNDNWRDTQELQIEAAGLAPADDLESAIAVTLTSGEYTAIVLGKNDTTGVGLVEAYRLQQ